MQTFLAWLEWNEILVHIVGGYLVDEQWAIVTKSIMIAATHIQQQGLQSQEPNHHPRIHSETLLFRKLPYPSSALSYPHCQCSGNTTSA
jgi:hypothetical protein